MAYSGYGRSFFSLVAKESCEGQNMAIATVVEYSRFPCQSAMERDRTKLEFIVTAREQK
ncbi:MAG: hypothetical protein WCD53_29085 [Microcoleus sp.]